ncbi:hypothetical protein A2Z33_01285 [Candidatus Gottesmanbacteria bacterium RBG_16_52_11]|uniref:Pseudouridine synthase n=1 Tax=Candidatus Gottesmanbacteria bacterium RBG_16_52_11 TaxID=1798374 RepID=A0A1F5YPF4_9BACT|nr:MAG: hypothetical protein A2Z33_01285 [Candidatus Gottesmanbacteria bacterium RBG_16_52_11]
MKAGPDRGFSHIPVVFEDEVILAVDKPPGTVVNKAVSVNGYTVQDFMQSRFPDIFPEQPGTGDDFLMRSGIVHRLDKETSGILILAKTREAYAKLINQFKHRLVKKSYLALVHGKVVPAEGEIRAPVGRLPWNPERFGIVPEGKEAVTGFRTLEYLILDSPTGDMPATRLILKPLTGRTHQIRVHLKYINHPILGDYLYAGRKTSRDDRIWIPRVMLHAYDITIRHPVSGQNQTLTAPEPHDMMDVRARVTGHPNT